MAWHNYWMLIVLSLRLWAGASLCSGRGCTSGIRCHLEASSLPFHPSPRH